MLKKPHSCRGCVLETLGRGYAPAVGPGNAKILLVGESLGDVEVVKGEPFRGPAGEMLDRCLRLVGWDRKELRIDNLVRCQPPNNHLSGAHYEYSAVTTCAQYLEQTIADGPKVIVALGGVPTRRLLGLGAKKHKQADWHGTVNESVYGIPLVPTFHPSFLIRGNQKLIGTVCYDLLVAAKVLNGSWSSQPASEIVDPDIGWFRDWAERCGPEDWLAVDVETIEKLTGKAEDELEGTEDEIVRINFAYHPDEGVTVPWTGQYIDVARKLLAQPGVKCFWNARFDTPRLRGAGCVLGGRILDFMWAWHVLQSDLPRGLGFVAPFYSRYGAWKHLSGSDPGLYASIDAFQTLRCAFGIGDELQREGQWDTFYSHVYELDTLVLHPAEEVGLLVDVHRLEAFRLELQEKLAEVAERIHQRVPPEILPEKVWKHQPADLDVREERRRDLVQVCNSCGEVEVSKSHACQPKVAKEKRTLHPQIVWAEAEVTRWVKTLPFNPQSTDHIRSYAEVKGYKLSVNKRSKSGKASTDKKALEKLAKKDQFFKDILEHRTIGKVLGTYVEGTRKRLGKDGRIHAKFLHKPSTLRLSCVDPNLTNVRTDRDGADSPAAGFRHCLVASS